MAGSKEGQADSAQEGIGQAEAGNEQVLNATEAQNAAGFRGTVLDPTPNENYTVAGVTSGAPTPETDDELAEEARRVTAAAGVANSK